MNTIWFPDLSAADGPKYLALVAAIRSAIVSEQLDVGERLPPVRELGWQLKGHTGNHCAGLYKIDRGGPSEGSCRARHLCGRAKTHDGAPD